MMPALRSILGGLVGLFVDDGALAIGLVAWTALMALAVRAWPGLPSGAFGPAWFFGCVAVLIATVARAAGARRR